MAPPAAVEKVASALILDHLQRHSGAPPRLLRAVSQLLCGAPSPRLLVPGGGLALADLVERAIADGAAAWENSMAMGVRAFFFFFFFFFYFFKSTCVYF
jgi:hypothetical protein